jgi:hypothetical protein
VLRLKMCLLKKSTSLEYFIFFDRMEVFAKASKHFFVIRSSHSIKWCEKAKKNLLNVWTACTLCWWKNSWFCFIIKRSFIAFTSFEWRYTTIKKLFNFQRVITLVLIFLINVHLFVDSWKLKCFIRVLHVPRETTRPMSTTSQHKDLYY